METTLNHRAVLSFMSNLGERVQLTIPRARLDKTPEDAKDAMENIIATGAVVTGNGIPVAVKSAKIISTERRPIFAAG